MNIFQASPSFKPFRMIPLNSGLFTIVDEEDYNEVSKHTWYAARTGNKFYACRISDGMYLHRFLLNPEEGKLVDHCTGLTLDNRRSNLRECTPKENARNSIKKSTNTTGYKGVTYQKKTGLFQARIRTDKGRISLGYFDTAEAAGSAYTEASKKYHEEFYNIGEYQHGHL